MENQVLQRLRAYTRAVYKLDFKLLVDEFFYVADLKLYHETMLWMAEHMEPFGETTSFLKLFPTAKTVDDLKKMSMENFIATFISKGIQKVGTKELKEMIASIKITDLKRTDDLVVVFYELDNVFEKESQKISSQLEMILVEEQWYFKFKSGLQSFMGNYKRKINDFYEREKKDDETVKDNEEEELERYELYGYQTYDGQPVIEPRFRDAGNFSEGLAFAKVFSKYGYIDRQGAFVIPPQFDEADVFWDGRAQVGMRNENWKMRYGFIDTTGKQVVPFIYNEVNDFNEKMAAVCKNEKWGFIDLEGNVVVELIYDRIRDFDEGEAALYKATEEGYKVFIIDAKGNVKDSFIDDTY